jgi:hypothetical protein
VCVYSVLFMNKATAIKILLLSLAGILLIVVAAYILAPKAVSSLNQKVSSLIERLVPELSNKKQTKKANSGKVLGLTDAQLKTLDQINFNLPAIFNDYVNIGGDIDISGNALFEKDATVSGTMNVEQNLIVRGQQVNFGTASITAGNVLYSVTGGSGISITTGQTPTITNTGVLSLQGETGALELEEGDNITIDGLKISADIPDASDAFKTYSVTGQSDIVADSSSDTFTFTAGSNIALTTTESTDSLTIGLTGTIPTTNGGTGLNTYTTGDLLYSSATNTLAARGIGATGQVLTVVGGVPTWASVSGASCANCVFMDPSASQTITPTAGTATGLTVAQASGGSVDVFRVTNNAGSTEYLEINSSGNVATSGNLTAGGTLNATGATTLSSTLGVSGLSTLAGISNSSGITNTGGITNSGGINNGSGGITNAGSITGATGLTSSGTITFSGLGTGIVHSNGSGVLSSSALNLAGGATEVTGALPATNGGTGLTTYTTGDLLYASATNVLSKIGIGASDQILAVVGGVPTWATAGDLGIGGTCSNCILTDPGSTQTIIPSAGTATGLSVRAASGGNSADIFNVADAAGTTKYLTIEADGDVILGNGGISTGTFTINPTGADPLAITPNTSGLNSFTGTITSNDLTATRTWTLPDSTGIFCLSTGNCNGSGTNLSGSGTQNFVAKFSGQYGITDSQIFDNGTNVGINDPTPSFKLDVNGTLNATGATTFGSTLGVTGNTNLLAGLDVTGAADLNSTLDVTGATTLSSTLGVTGNATFNGLVGVGTTPTTKLQVLATTEQLRLNYDVSNYSSFTVGSSGDLTIAATGADVIIPVGTHLTARDSIFFDDGFGNAAELLTSAGDILYLTNATTVMRPDGSTNAFEVAGVPAAGSSGNILGSAQTLNAMNGSDTVRGLYLNLTNGNHTGSSNIFNGIQVSGITGDAEATETGLSIGSGWDYAAVFDGNVGIGDTSPTALFTVGSGDAFQINASGAIAAATGITSSGTVTFSGLGTGVVQANSSGVLSSSALNLAGGSSLVTGTLPATNGGTGIATYTTGDILYASATNVLSKLGIGNSNEVLTVTGGVPVWTTVASAGGMTSFTAAGDSGGGQSISNGNTLSVLGGTNGIDTIDSATDTITLNLDTTEIGSTTFGSGSGITWTFDGSAGTDTSVAFGNDTQTFTAGTSTFSGDVAVNGGDLTTNQSTATLFNTTATTLSLGGAATTALNIGNGSGAYTAINLGSGSGTHTINIAGTGATSADTINIGTGGTAADTINIGSNASSTALNLTSGTGAQSFTSSVATGTTTSSAFAFNANSLTTGTGLYLASSSLTSGTLQSLSSTSTTLTSGGLMALDWTPGSATTGTGDLLSLNIGPNGNIGNLLNIKDNGSSVFSVSETGITSALPHSFTAAGDVSFANNIAFTNQTASAIKSNASLAIEAGELFESNDLTLRTYNSGQLILDAPGGTILQNAAFNIANTSGSNLFTVNSSGNITALNNVAYSWPSSQAAGSGYTLSNNGSGTLTWVAAATGTMSSFTLSGDSGSDQTISDANTLEVAGGTNGIDTVGTATDTITLNLDTTEIGSTTFGSGSGITWTFDAGATDPTIAFASDAMTFTAGTSTFSGDVGVNGGDLTTSQTTATLFNTTATTLSLGGAATTALNIGNGSGAYTAINLGSGSGTHTINIAGTGATSADTINIGTGGTAADTINIGSTASTTALNLTSGTGSQTFASSVVSGTTTTSAFVFNANSLTTGTGLYLASSSLTSGTLQSLSSTSTALTSGGLMALDWTPGSSTTGTGDLLSLNIGPNGTMGNLLNIKDNGTSLFSVSETAITSALPHSFTAAGDVAIAYDIQFTNQTASYLKSNAPLYIEAGESFESNDLTLQTYNSGSIALDTGATGTIDLLNATTFGAQITFTAADTTPDVSAGSHFLTAGTATITDFDAGSGTLKPGHIIFIECNTGVTFDVTSSGLNGGGADLVCAAGDTTTWIYDGTDWNLISWMDDSDNQSGGDIAEWFVGSETLEPGDVVSIDDQAPNEAYVKKSSTFKDKKAIGIVATQPGIVLSEPATQNAYPIALAGRVPVKVSTEKGAIQKGDFLTPSSTPGVAVKATTAGQTIGKALESYSGTEIGKVIAFVNTSWYDPDSYLDSIADASFTNNGASYALSNAGSAISRLGLFSDAAIANLSTGVIDAKEIKINGESLKDFLNTSSATSAIQVGETTTQSVKMADVYKALDDEYHFETSISSLIIKKDLIVDAALNVKGDVTIEGNLIIKGKTTFENETLFNKVATFFSNVIFRGKVSFEDTVAFNKDAAGIAIIEQNSDHVDIIFDKEYEQPPLITATMVHEGEATASAILKTFYVTNKTTKGFTIKLDVETLDDTSFNWLAVAVIDPKTARSSDIILSTPSPTVDPLVQEGIDKLMNSTQSAQLTQ